MRAAPATTRTQVEQVLARMAAYPRRVDQELYRLREGIALRWVPPREVLERVLVKIDGQLTQEVDNSPEALLAGYRDIAKRIEPELPKLFAKLPRAPYGVRAMPAYRGPDAAEYYDAPALDGSKPGWFNANALAWRTRPIWGMETLVAHEAMPGHHLQVARAVELGELPKFRRGNGFTVYSEGWALYAETLGSDLGLYKDPYSRFGHLQWQAFRAVHEWLAAKSHNGPGTAAQPTRADARGAAGMAAESLVLRGAVGSPAHPAPVPQAVGSL